MSIRTFRRGRGDRHQARVPATARRRRPWSYQVRQCPAARGQMRLRIWQYRRFWDEHRLPSPWRRVEQLAEATTVPRHSPRGAGGRTRLKRLHRPAVSGRSPAPAMVLKSLTRSAQIVSIPTVSNLDHTPRAEAEAAPRASIATKGPCLICRRAWRLRKHRDCPQPRQSQAQSPLS